MLNEILFVTHVLRQLRQYNRDDEFKNIRLNSNSIFRIEMNQHENLNESLEKLAKRFHDIDIKHEELILLFLFIVFQQLRHESSDSREFFHKISIKIDKFQKDLKFSQNDENKSRSNNVNSTRIHRDLVSLNYVSQTFNMRNYKDTL